MVSLALKKDAVQSGYKQTELGLIPEDWDIVELRDIAKFENGVAHEMYVDVQGQYKLVNSKFISTNGAVGKKCSKALRIAEVGDLLFVMSDVPNGRALARCFLVSCAETYAVNQRICRISTGENCSKLIGYIIDRNPFYLAFDDGAKQTNLKKDDVLSCKFPIPNKLEEQNAIAKALSDADGLIEALSELIAKKRQIKQGAMQDLLTGKKRLAGFEGDWEEHSIEDIADKNIQWSFTGGPFGSNLKSSDYVSEGVRVIQLQNIGDGIFLNDEFVFTSIAKANELLSCNIYPDDIILSKMGDPVARACIIPSLHDRYLMCSDGIRLAVDKKKFDNYFIFYSINFETFRKSADNAGTGSTRKRIGLSELRKLTIKCPSLLEQSSISKIIVDMDTEISALETKLEKAKQIKQGMMQDLLSGKVRLI